MAEVVRFTPKKRVRVSDFYGTEWSVLPQPAILELAKRKDLSGETLRVLLVLFSMVEQHNRLRIYPEQVADELGVRVDSVRERIAKLVDAGVLKQLKYGWELTPRYGFKGDPDKDLRRAPGGELVLVDL